LQHWSLPISLCTMLLHSFCICNQLRVIHETKLRLRSRQLEKQANQPLMPAAGTRAPGNT
jgi:hypothetical protein